MSTIPSQMRALVIAPGGEKAQVVQDHPVPTLTPGEVLVRVHAAAQNPSDNYALAGSPDAQGNTLGCDFAGTVVALGPPPLRNGISIGDRVCGLVHGGIFKDKGAYAEYAKVDHDLLIKLPDGIGFQEGATFGLTFMTALHALYAHLKIRQPTVDNPLPSPQSILIWGGATSIGLFAIQLAKLSGLHVIATCSPSSSSLVASHGADSIYHYTNPDVVSSIREAHANLDLALDCVSNATTLKSCTAALGDQGGHVHALLPPSPDAVTARANVQVTFALVYTTLGRPYPLYYFESEPQPQDVLERDRALAAEWTNLDEGRAYALIKDGKLKPNPVRTWEGGLEGIPRALDLMKEGKVRGEKVVHVLL